MCYNLDMNILYLFLVVVFIFIVFPVLVRASIGNNKRYHYRAKSHMMTRAEERCFRSLEKKYGAKYYIVPQVHLSALLEHRVKGQNYRGAFSHINGKSVDFVLLDKKSFEVVCAVELDDHTHARADRAERDREVERIFEEAGVKLVRMG